MSDRDRYLSSIARRIGQTEVRETPALYLPWTQRVLNPFPLASSGTFWGDAGQPWPITILAFYCTVYVVTTNNGTNYWSFALLDNAGTTLATLTTAALAANTGTRLSVTSGIVQPASSSSFLTILPTAILNPGAIYLFPTLAVLRTG